MPINRCCGFFFRKVSPLIEKGWFVRWRRVRFNDFEPVFLGLFEKSVAVDVVHEHDPEHRGKIGKAPTALNAPLHDHEQ